MEQQLINLLMKLLAKAGSGSLIKDLIQQVDTNRNPKVWTPDEIEKAIDYVSWQVSNFGTAEAVAIIDALMKKYNLRPENFSTEDHPVTEPSGVPGLQ